MKNLFSIDQTEDIHSNRLDETPFHHEALSPELAAAVRKASDTAFEAFDQPIETPQSKRRGGGGGWQLGVGLLLTMTAIIPIFVWSDQLFSGDRAWVAWVLLAALVAGGVLVGWSYRIQRKTMQAENRERQERNASPENTAAIEDAMKELKRLQGQARQELGIPDTALEMDVFPFIYRRKGEEKVSLDKRDRYQSLLTLVWRRGDQLCLSDGSCTLCIPTDALRFRVDYDRPFVVDMWLHDQRPDAGRFQPYHLKRTGLLSAKGRGLHGIVITTPSGDSYELLIPCYDLPQLEKIVTLPAKREPSEKG